MSAVQQLMLQHDEHVNEAIIYSGCPPCMQLILDKNPPRHELTKQAVWSFMRWDSSYTMPKEEAVALAYKALTKRTSRPVEIVRQELYGSYVVYGKDGYISREGREFRYQQRMYFSLPPASGRQLQPAKQLRRVPPRCCATCKYIMIEEAAVACQRSGGYHGDEGDMEHWFYVCDGWELNKIMGDRPSRKKRGK